MNEKELLEAICLRAANPIMRSDYANIRLREIGPPATPADIAAVELIIGCALSPLHRRLLLEVGNGGFGPGDGLIGLPRGSLDVDGRSIIGLREALGLGRPPVLSVVPLCEWGCGIWSCIDNESGAVLTMSGFGLKDIGQKLHSWFGDWVSGVDLWRRMVVVEDRSTHRPKTQEWITVQVVTRVVGKPYAPRS
jgi:hypothetical protein